jgi:hypothetical protein
MKMLHLSIFVLVVSISLLLLSAMALMGVAGKACRCRSQGVQDIVDSVHDGNTYIAGVFNCNNITMLAVDNLRESGYEAYYVRGENVNSSLPAHAWVKVCQDYDVTNGGAPSSDFTSRAILEYSEGKLHGYYCPWMNGKQWCDFFDYNCKEYEGLSS